MRLSGQLLAKKSVTDKKLFRNVVLFRGFPLNTGTDEVNNFLKPFAQLEGVETARIYKANMHKFFALKKMSDAVYMAFMSRSYAINLPNYYSLPEIVPYDFYNYFLTNFCVYVKNESLSTDRIVNMLRKNFPTAAFYERIVKPHDSENDQQPPISMSFQNKNDIENILFFDSEYKLNMRISSLTSFNKIISLGLDFRDYGIYVLENPFLQSFTSKYACYENKLVAKNMNIKPNKDKMDKILAKSNFVSNIMTAENNKDIIVSVSTYDGICKLLETTILPKNYSKTIKKQLSDLKSNSKRPNSKSSINKPLSNDHLKNNFESKKDSAAAIDPETGKETEVLDDHVPVGFFEPFLTPCHSQSNTLDSNASNNIVFSKLNYTEYPQFLLCDNFAKSATMDDIKSYFHKIGAIKVKTIQIINNDDSTSAIVEFANIFEASCALLKSNSLFNDRMIHFKRFRLYGRRPKVNYACAVVYCEKKELTKEDVINFIYPFVAVTTKKIQLMDGMNAHCIFFRNKETYNKFLNWTKFTHNGHFVSVLSLNRDTIKNHLTPNIFNSNLISYEWGNILNYPIKFDVKKIQNILGNSYEEAVVVPDPNYEFFKVNKISDKNAFIAENILGESKKVNDYRLVFKPESDLSQNLQFTDLNSNITVSKNDFDENNACCVKILFKNFESAESFRIRDMLFLKKWNGNRIGALYVSNHIQSTECLNVSKVFNVIDIRGFSGKDCYADIINFIGCVDINSIIPHKYGHYVFLNNLSFKDSIVNRDGFYHNGRRILVKNVYVNGCHGYQRLALCNIASNAASSIDRLTINVIEKSYEDISNLVYCEPGTKTYLFNVPNLNSAYSLFVLNGLYFAGRHIFVKYVPDDL